VGFGVGQVGGIRGHGLQVLLDRGRGRPAQSVRLQRVQVLATPERNVIFDIHDLDETLPAPWEWDVKRLSASFVIAARNNGLSEKRAREAVLTCVRSYREHMSEFSEMRALDLWYYRLDADKLASFATPRSSSPSRHSDRPK
jgi:uncharacterized protein (DUF2252 family)